MCWGGKDTFVGKGDRLEKEPRAGGAQHYHSCRAKHYAAVRSQSAVPSINARQVVLMLQEPWAHAARVPLLQRF